MVTIQVDITKARFEVAPLTRRERKELDRMTPALMAYMRGKLQAMEVRLFGVPIEGDKS